MTLRTTAIVATASALAIGAAAPVQAQSRCGPSYVIQPGDTLYRVAQGCRVSLARIYQLNPQIDNPRDIEVGAELRLVARSDGSDPAPDRGETYRVEAGDTLNTIAEAFGVSLFELINANEDVEPYALAIGELLDIPGAQPSASVSITPRSGPEDATVTIRARNLRPGDRVTVGAGRTASEWRVLRQAEVASDGELSTTVPVPDWADPGDSLIYVVDTDRGMTFKSGVFDVVQEEQQVLLREGRVEEGVECPVLRADDGSTYALTSRTIRFTPGEYVQVTGPRAEMSYCQQGAATIDVREIEEIAPPRDDGPATGMTLEGRVRDGTECPVLVTPDGDRYALTSGDIPFTTGEYVEVSGDRVEMSYCMEGIATLNVTDLQEVRPPQ